MSGLSGLSRVSGCLPLIALAWVLGCASTGKWESASLPRERDAAILLETQGPAALSRDARPEGAPPVPIRERLRPCCAFGAEIGVEVAGVPVPGVELRNIRGLEELGPHRYDAGALVVEPDRGDGNAIDENNGLIYTCRGGFIDTAHVRDYTDWAMYLSARFGAHLDDGVIFDLPDEAGTRRFVLDPIPKSLIEKYTRREIFSALAQWGAWQLSVWHEIATWFGFHVVAGFSEQASAFSPEDLYSNLIGIRILDGIIADKTGRTEHIYNDSVETWLDEILAHLGAVSAETGSEAMRAVDQHWWDSSHHLPDPRLVTRRNVDIGSPLEPWLVPERLMTPALRERLASECPNGQEPQPLPRPDRLGRLIFADFLTLEIGVDDQLLAVNPFTTMEMPLSQVEFPALVEFVRIQLEKKVGPWAYTPDDLSR